jgi:hypothetical protein
MRELYVSNVSFLLANNLKVPFPDFSGDWFTDRTEHAEMIHLVMDMMISGPLEQSQSGRSNIKLGDLVLLDDIPVA